MQGVEPHQQPHHRSAPKRQSLGLEQSAGEWVSRVAENDGSRVLLHDPPAVENDAVIQVQRHCEIVGDEEKGEVSFPQRRCSRTRTCTCTIASSAERTSSQTSMSGSANRALAIATCWRWPPGTGSSRSLRTGPGLGELDRRLAAAGVVQLSLSRRNLDHFYSVYETALVGEGIIIVPTLIADAGIRAGRIRAEQP
jgi:hypothetical protein